MADQGLIMVMQKSMPDFCITMLWAVLFFSIAMVPNTCNANVYTLETSAWGQNVH